ncbi:MAG: hypothetical protein ABW047_00020 [Nitrospiraceae bacterium]
MRPGSTSAPLGACAAGLACALPGLVLDVAADRSDVAGFEMVSLLIVLLLTGTLFLAVTLGDALSSADITVIGYRRTDSAPVVRLKP